ncbi:MAG: 3-deoxy-D-manno-octulosonic acid transferase [Thermodesulfobacteriota bacterium]|nr:3-deoxy-D-manno-octulosonic acid transferase [Thermodesulfobacteriota bacterium]
MIVLYNMVMLIGSALALPVIFAKILTSEKRQKTLVRRFHPDVCIRASEARPIWVHALSVGEVLASIPLVRELRKTHAHWPVVVSVSTLTGYEIAKRMLEGHVDQIFFFPYDLVWSVRRIIRSIHPAVFILVESDIWPNFVYEMKRQHIPFVLVNGRVSPRSFSGYGCLSFFMRHVFSNVSSICTQTDMDAKRFRAIGAPTEKIHITGNMKFDQTPVFMSGEEIRKMRASLGITPAAKVVVAGSTHEGEEAMLSRCFQVLKRNFPDLVLVLVPRDPARAKRIQEMLSQNGCLALLRTQSPRIDVGPVPEVIIVDTMGELRRLYAIADVVFVGKSLVDLGGQNPLEPAAVRKPILFGPYMFNFESIAGQLVQQGGASLVANEADLLDQLDALLADVGKCEAMGMEAYRVFKRNRGAVDKTLKVIEEFL